MLWWGPSFLGGPCQQKGRVSRVGAGSDGRRPGASIPAAEAEAAQGGRALGRVALDVRGEGRRGDGHPGCSSSPSAGVPGGVDVGTGQGVSARFRRSRLAFFFGTTPPPGGAGRFARRCAQNGRAP